MPKYLGAKIISSTATIIVTNPKTSEIVNGSSNTMQPKNTAVAGSRTPRIAAGVEPIFLIDTAKAMRETVVGTSPSPARQSHEKASGTACS